MNEVLHKLDRNHQTNVFLNSSSPKRNLKSDNYESTKIATCQITISRKRMHTRNVRTYHIQWAAIIYNWLPPQKWLIVFLSSIKKLDISFSWFFHTTISIYITTFGGGVYVDVGDWMECIYVGSKYFWFASEKWSINWYGMYI